MLKRIEKRRRKQKEEEELGLDGEMKEILGIQDTDSEESDSDSDSAPDDEDIQHGGSDDGEQEEEQESGQGEESDITDEGAGGDEEDEDEPPMTVQEALRDPLYVVSIQPTVRACVVCPGKLLKTGTMVDVHKTSQAHQRRLKQFLLLVKDADPNSNAWEVVHQTKPAKPLPSKGDNSKRALKREALKAKREKRKAAAKSKKALASAVLEATSDPPAKKKQKIKHSEGEDDPASKLTTPLGTGTLLQESPTRAQKSTRTTTAPKAESHTPTTIIKKTGHAPDLVKEKRKGSKLKGGGRKSRV